MVSKEYKTMKHEELMLLPQKSRISSSHNGGMTHVIRIHEDISDPSNWSEELDLINSVGEQDTVVLDVCSPGGYLDTAMLFHRALNNCAGHTVAIIGPECASAASVISLSCREWILDDTSSLMIHTSSYSLGGKDTDILEHANFSRGQLKRLYEKVYSGFLSPEDLSDVIKGTPFYFDVEQIAQRLDSLQEYRASQPCNCGEEDCPQNARLAQETQEEFVEEQHISLDEIIANAVESGIQNYEKKRLAKEAKASNVANKKETKVEV
jgi:ATP-dependent protease ClpP protease subunit